MKKIIFLKLIISFCFLIAIILRAITLQKYLNEKQIIERNTTLKTKIVEIKSKYLIVLFRNHFYYLRKNNFLEKNKDNYSVDDFYYFCGEKKKLLETNNFFEFNFKEYLKTKLVKESIFVNENKCEQKIVINKLSPRSYFLKFQNYQRKTFSLLKRENVFYENWLELFFFQQSSSIYGDEIVYSLQKLGALSFIVISGLHINFLFSILTKIFSFFIRNKQKQKKCHFLSLMLIFVFVYLVNFPLACFRAFTFLAFKRLDFLKNFLKTKNNNVLNIEILFLIFLIFLLWNPLFIFRIGFQLTFLVSFLLMFCQFFFKKLKFKKNILKKIFSYSTIYLFLIPYQLLFLQEINVFGLFFYFILEKLFFFLFFIAFVIFVFPFFGNFFEFIFFFSTKIIIFLHKKSIYLKFFYPSFVFTLVFFSFLFLMYCFCFLLGKRKFVLLPLFVICIPFSSIKMQNQKFYEVTFLNVGGGMSIIVTSPHKKEKILVDAGAGRGISKEVVVHYLKSKGIHQIDYLYITHFHDDHTNNIPFIKKEIKIKKVLTNLDFFKETVLNSNFKVNNLSYRYLNFQKNWNENNKSLVLNFSFLNYNFLITGDIEKQAEQEVEKFISPKKTILLQVPHHGSSISSNSPSFLKRILPKYCVISGKQTPFLKKTFSSLKEINCRTYSTFQNKTVIFKFFKEKITVSTMK